MSTLEQEFNSARQRVLSGEHLPLEEQARLVKLLRENRFSSAEAGGKARSTGKAAKVKATGISDEDLDSQLDDLGL